MRMDFAVRTVKAPGWQGKEAGGGRVQVLCQLASQPGSAGVHPLLVNVMARLLHPADIAVQCCWNARMLRNASLGFLRDTSSPILHAA